MRVERLHQGSDAYGAMAPFTDKGQRAKVWNSLLKDNESGQVINNNGALHYEDHKRMLDDVEAVRKYMPTAFSTLSAVPGITVPVSITDTLIGYQNMNQFDAQTSMDGSNRKTNQSNYQYNWVPQPIYHCDFEIPWRQNGFGYKTTDGTSEGTTEVMLERDKVMINGDSNINISVNGQAAPLYGLSNSPFTNAVPGGISDWNVPANLVNAHKEIIALLAEGYSDQVSMNIPNTVIMFVANDFYPLLENDYSDDKGDRTVRERIEAITAIKEIQPCQWLPDGSVLLVEAMSRTIRIAQSTDITVVPKIRTHEMEPMKMTIMAASTPQVRADRNGNTGIIFATQ